MAGLHGSMKIGKNMKDTITIPLDLFSDLTDYSFELRGEWGWKQGERAGNGEEYARLHATTALAQELRIKAESRRIKP